MNFLILNSILALLGISISWKIFQKKKTEKQFVCYVGANCVDVLTSKFSRFFGVDIERIGFVYYFLIFAGYISIMFTNELADVPISFLLFILSSAGLGFSFYLIFVQAIYLKKWCPLCLTSATTSIIIFAISYIITSKQFALISVLLVNLISYLNIIQLIAIAIGTGTATISVILTIKFLKDFKIDSHEDKKLTILDQIIWFSITILVLVNLCFFIIDKQSYLNSVTLSSQLIMFIVLIINNAFLSLYINPKLIGIRIDMKSINVWKTFWLRQVALAFSTISIISWYAILFVLFFANITNSDIVFVISYYLATLIITVVLSQVVILFIDKIRITSDNIYKLK